jgi:4-amino-4-deoxy-L-arabinose transferase-like glycosyltransferase
MDSINSHGDTGSSGPAITWRRPPSWLESDTNARDFGLIEVPTVLLITAMYLLVGLVGHDPWRPDEIYAFGIVYDFLSTSGDWVIPTVAGQPFMEKPPLLYWVAATFARVFSGWLPLHDGARLAVGLFMGITCAATASAARQWWGSGSGRLAVLALLGCLGLVQHSHMLLTDVPLLTGFALATCGIAFSGNRPVVGGLLLGTGVGVGFLAKGLIAPGVIGITVGLLTMLFPAWRTRDALWAFAIAIVAALPWLTIWPIALYLRSPTLFMEWFWSNNVGRFIGFSVTELGARNEQGFWWRTVLWFAFPALPLAIFTLWRFRTRSWNTPAIQVCVLLSIVIVAVLGISASARANYFLPLLIPVSLLAAPGAARLNGAVNKVLDRSAKIIFALLASFLWLVWLVMIVRGAPPSLPILSRFLPLDFHASFDLKMFFLALILSLAVVIPIVKLPAQPRALTSWVFGITLVWGLLFTLWAPWLDDAKSYRSVFVPMKQVLGTGYNCVLGTNLAESERGMLDYFAGVVTKGEKNGTAPVCDYWLYRRLAEGRPKEVDPNHWSLVWEGGRPGDMRERYFLFKALTAGMVAY